ncbi:hypothetical protein LQ564_15320 [Massilia sp. G4R7]|uniref:Uncharacterized protein n=1 Tax=Massilia phyllostachyos TaxID=2898585 RepID=A0ABS8Q7G2_9BURK|nr:hypothetical protein [Massilia phyllostachyos]MCD2517684.1 hypothetical protein [Massilia phyllostachyos]
MSSTTSRRRLEGLAVRRGHGNAGRSGAAQLAQQLGQALRHGVGPARQLLRQRAQRAVLGRVVGRARGALVQRLRRVQLIDIKHCLFLHTIAHRDVKTESTSGRRG